MADLGMLVQHLWVLFLIVGIPLWDWYEIPRLKASPDPRKKVRYYLKIVTALWVLTVGAGLSIGLVTIFTIQRMPGEIPWLDSGSVGNAVLKGFTLRNVDCDPAAGGPGSVQ